LRGLGRLFDTLSRNERLRMPDLILRLMTALSIGLLVGLERGWREQVDPDGHRAAGIRTFAIVGLLGGVLAALTVALQTPLIFAAGLLAFTAVFAWFHALEAKRVEAFSVTSVVAGLCVFSLGGLAVLGDQVTAAAGASGLAALLASRELLHASLRRLTWEELRSALVLAVMTMIILPILPNRPLDPWGGFNPHEVWLFTVLIAAISFVGYIAVRMLGPKRGVLISGILGAVISSTAVTASLARMAAAQAMDAGLIRSLSGASALAAAVSLLRVLSVILVIRPALLAGVLGPALAAAAVFALSGLLMTFGARAHAAEATPARNPFEIKPLVIFGGLFAAFSTLSAASLQAFGTASVFVSSMLAGAVDADVAILSAMRLKQSPDAVIVLAILLALAANATMRFGLAATLSPRRFFLPLGAITGMAIIAGAVVAWLQWS
jgi:uncharacterized membrane protein (DUF4010 family)